MDASVCVNTMRLAVAGEGKSINRKTELGIQAPFVFSPQNLNFLTFVSSQGFDDDDGLFGSIPERNAVGLKTVFTTAEGLFEQMTALTKQHEDWVILDSVDMDSYLQSTLSDVPEWEANFKSLKKKRKDSERLPDSQKVGIFVVSFIPFKTAIEEQIQRFSDGLMLSLRKSAARDLEEVDEYLNSGMQTLRTKPQTLAEMGAAKGKWKDISSRKKEYQRNIAKLQKKNNLLRQMGATAVDMSHLKPLWKDFLETLDAFHAMLDEQRDELKQGIQNNIKEVSQAVDVFASRWKALKPNVEGQQMTSELAAKCLADIETFKQEFEQLKLNVAKVTEESEHFDDLPIPQFENLGDVQGDIEEHEKAWALYGEFTKELESMAGELWVAFRSKIFSFEDFVNVWQKRIKDQPRGAIFDYISREVRQKKAVWPILRKCTGELFEKEHWKILFGKLKFPSSMSIATLTLGHLLKKQDVLIQIEQDINNLAARAQGEVTIREAVQELKVWAEQTEFELIEHKTIKGVSTHLVKGWKDLFTKVSDQQSLVASLKESPYYGPFSNECNRFAEKIGILDKVLHAINQIQRKWVYLEPIFARGSLPSESARFDRIDKEFRQIMAEIKRNPNVLTLASLSNLTQTVDLMLDQLERCQKALNDFLEEKRNKFARFYFIGDDDLLEILGQAQNPAVIDNHLKKLFMGVHSVDFSEDKTQILSMKSSQNEVVRLLQPVQITEFVEDWLHNLAVAMEETLKSMLNDCVKECDYNKFPSQVLCIAEMVMYTQRVESALESGKLEELHAELKEQLSQLTSTDTTEDHLLMLKFQALVMDLIHNIDVVEQLVKAKATTVDHWMWQKQLRYYIDRSGCCVMRMCDAEFKYSYEYQGNADKLVHTPLTDKCYLVLTNGMHLGYGGNPYGPAGTGKTESVKALGQAFGRQVLVFNCDEGIDFKSMGRIFTGLVKSGAWGCFDEFNRLKEDQLSAVSQQIQVIQAALKKGDATTQLLGRTIEVNSNAAIFVTMNPASKEYGGRSKLPHNLKQLFRAVAMSVPDVGLIGETILYAEGFKHANIVGRKVVEVYQLSKQLLSPQQHYDWGLRALKTILRHGGQLIKIEKKEGRPVDLNVEIRLMIGALKINTLSKLTATDAVRFKALINDVFPGVDAEDIDYKELEAAIRSAIDDLKLLQSDVQVAKILQLHEALNQRMGVVVVGPSGCGKTVMLNVLHLALKKLGQTVVRHVMNPKALEREKLLGYMDHDTREWFDGVLTYSARQVMKESLSTHSWIICDGDIDPEWVESLNSVLDDNHLLTMPNGERIKFLDNVNFVFETHDLQFASPATISRMGMIFLSEEDIDIRSLLKAWVAKQPEAMQNMLSAWLEELFHQALAWVQEKGEAVVASTKVGLVSTCLSHLEGATAKGDFIMGLIRGMGSNLDIPTRAEFATAVFEWCGERQPDRKDPLNCTFDGSFQTYLPDDTDLVPEELSATSPPIINTVDVQRNRDLVKPWLKSMEPFILVGPEGCGKSLLLSNSFKKIRGTSIATIHCSAQTKASHVIQRLSEACASFSTSTGRVLRPKEGDRLILWLKDLNLPKPDMYDTIQLVAFLQQLITYQGFYNDDLEWIGIDKIQIVASMNPATTVGRSQLSTRFTAITHVAFITYPEQAQLQTVYTAFLKSVLSLSKKLADPQFANLENQQRLTGSMVQLYAKVKEKFTVDDHRHYMFNPRDLTNWVFGLLRYDLSSQSLLDCWAYEAQRLFADRLVSQEDIKKFATLLNGVLQSVWRHQVANGDFYFSTFVSADVGAADGKARSEMGTVLERIPVADFKETVSVGIHTYERENRDLNMLLFPEILDHIAYEDRVLSRPGGSLLLVGDSGVGRRTSVTLVAHLQHLEFVSPNVTATYTDALWKNELKELVKLAGVEGRGTVFFIEDHHIVLESFLEDINSLLSAGMVPGLFKLQELDALLSPIKEEFASDGRFRNVNDFFVSRVKANLHIVLSLDPSNPRFALRCESNPAIYTQCSIIWMGRWSKTGMTEVPKIRLDSILSQLDENKGVTPSAVLEQVVHIHTSMLDYGATPQKYVSFLETYVNLFESNRKSLEEKRKHLSGGLLKMQEAEETVAVLSKDAVEKKKLVSEKQQEADKALERITEKMKAASERKQEVEEIQVKLGEEEGKLQGRKEKIQEELKEVEPVLAEAKAAVGGIRKDNINEIRAFRQPPAAIRHVLAGVLTLLGESDLSWQYMRSWLAKPSVKEEIINFDAEKITADVRKKVISLVKKNADSFVHEKIAHVNQAAAPMATWVKALIRYSTVLQSVLPLKQEFDQANAKLDDARDRLQQCKDDLKKIDEDVKVLKQNFGKMTSEAEALKVALKKTTDILEAAESLLDKLSGEKSRWDKQVKSFGARLAVLPSYALLAAGFICYLGPYPEETRQQLLAEWKAKCNLSKFQFMNFMATESDFLRWKAEGLPSDSLSMQNGLLITNSIQTSFIIDPNSQAAKWLQVNLKDCPLEVVTPQEQRFVTTVELSVRFGKTLIIQEMDGVMPMLYPLLRRDLVRQGPRNVIKVGDKFVDFNDNFRLYLVTRDPSPDIPSPASSIITEVNFTVTRSGLEGQLLGITLNHEKPELEQQKSKLLAEEDSLKIKLADLEKALLEELAASEGNILENKALIESLDQTKTESTKIAESLKTSKEVSADLDRQREVYRPIAHTGSILYFLLTQLRSVNNMYEFSLPSFVKLFEANLAADKEQGDRIGRLTKSLKLRTFTYVTRSLFKDDRLMFGMHLVHCLHPQRFKENEWEFFTGELVSSDDGKPAKLPRWAGQERAEAWKSFSSQFAALTRNLNVDDHSWLAWAKNPRCELDMPSQAGSAFQRLLVLQTLRPDRLQSAIQVYVCEALEVSSVSPPPLNFADLVKETSPSEAILFVTTAGADPTQELEEFAVKTVGKNSFAQLALGSGQTDLALEMLEKAAKEGSWLCLKNLHLVTTFLVDLEKALKAASLTAKPSFRLWLTTEPHASFPSILLQQSLKITYESPPGIKQNLLRTYEAWDEAYIEKGSVTRAQMLFVLAWFHAIMQERRVFIPQGFTKFYEFSFTDCRSGADIIDAICERLTGGKKVETTPPENIPWSYIWGLMKFAIYGGRIDNDHDVRVLVTYLGLFFHKDILSANRGPSGRKLTPGMELPFSNSRADYIRLINQLPNTDVPSTFGLPENIEGALQQQQSQAVIAQLRKLAVSGNVSAKFNREVWRSSLGPLLNMWTTLTAENGRAVLAKPAKLVRDEADLSPVESFVVLENHKVFKLVMKVHKCISELSNVIHGTGLLTPDLFSIGTTLLTGNVPWVWVKNW